MVDESWSGGGGEGEEDDEEEQKHGKDREEGFIRVLGWSLSCRNMTSLGGYRLGLVDGSEKKNSYSAGIFRPNRFC